MCEAQNICWNCCRCVLSHVVLTANVYGLTNFMAFSILLLSTWSGRLMTLLRKARHQIAHSGRWSHFCPPPNFDRQTALSDYILLSCTLVMELLQFLPSSLQTMRFSVVASGMYHVRFMRKLEFLPIKVYSTQSLGLTLGNLDFFQPFGRMGQFAPWQINRA